jgi:hypothetical protein
MKNKLTRNQDEDLKNLIEIFKESEIFTENDIRETFETENFSFNDAYQSL